jgi:hypothetical protein
MGVIWRRRFEVEILNKMRYRENLKKKPSSKEFGNAEKLARNSIEGRRAKSAIGRKLLALRNQFVAEGGELLDAEGIAAELRKRRGGLTSRRI